MPSSPLFLLLPTHRASAPVKVGFAVEVEAFCEEAPPLVKFVHALLPPLRKYGVRGGCVRAVAAVAVLPAAAHAPRLGAREAGHSRRGEGLWRALPHGLRAHSAGLVAAMPALRGVLYAMAAAQVWSLRFLHEFVAQRVLRGYFSFPSRTRL